MTRTLILAAMLAFATPASAQYCNPYCQDEAADAERYRRQYQSQWFENQQLEQKLYRERQRQDDYEFQQNLNSVPFFDYDDDGRRPRRRR